jgi:hypothetical protein
MKIYEGLTHGSAPMSYYPVDPVNPVKNVIYFFHQEKQYGKKEGK